MKQKRIISLLLLLLLMCQMVSTALAANTGPEIIKMEVSIPAKRAVVTLNADGRDAILLVAVYTGDLQLAEVQEQTVSGVGTQEVSVQFTANYPENFRLRAMLVDRTDYTPLCASCTEYSESLKPTIYDYEEDRVLNFDGRADENFAALAKGVIVLRESSDFDRLELPEANVYNLSGVSGSAANALAEGARVVILGEDNSYSVKIASLSWHGGSAVTLYGQQPETDAASIGEFFDYLTIDQRFQGGEQGEIIYADGVVPVQSARLMERGTVTVPETIRLGMKKEILGIELDGNLTAKLLTRATFQFGKDEKNQSHWTYRISMDNTFDMDVTLSGSVSNNNADDEEYEVSICKIRKWVPQTPVEFTANISLPLRIELNGECSMETTIRMLWSMTGSDRTEPVIEQTYSIDDFQADAKVEFVVDTGVSVTVGLEAVRLLYVEGGAQFRERMNALWTLRSDGDEQHPCNPCIDGTITPYIKLWFNLGIKDFLGERHTLWEKEKTFEWRDRIQRFYISCYEDQVTFGWGECPHHAYRLGIGFTIGYGPVTLRVTDDTGQVVDERTSGNQYPRFTIYLPKGTYTIRASAQGYQPAGVVYTVAGRGDITLLMNPEDSEWITSPVGVTGAIEQSGNRYQLFTYNNGSIQVFGAPLSKEEMKARVSGGERIYWINWGKRPLVTGVYEITKDGVLDHGQMDKELDQALYYIQIDGDAIHSIAFGAGCNSEGFEMPLSAFLTSLSFNGGEVNSIYNDCPNLTEVGGLETVTAINAISFARTGLQSADLSSTTDIYQYAFQDCEELAGVKLGSGTVKYSAFGSCSKLKTVDFGSVETIGELAFQDCVSLESAELPDTLKTLETQAFVNCEALTGVRIPGGVRFGNAVFRGCSNLREVDIADGMTEIPNGMFCACSSLEEVAIPDGATKLGEEAFLNCRSLERVRIPDSVTEIGWRCFAGCPMLMDIEYGGTMDQWASVSKSGMSSHRIQVHCTDGTVIV